MLWSMFFLLYEILLLELQFNMKIKWRWNVLVVVVVISSGSSKEMSQISLYHLIYQGFQEKGSKKIELGTGSRFVFWRIESFSDSFCLLGNRVKNYLQKKRYRN